MCALQYGFFKCHIIFFIFAICVFSLQFLIVSANDTEAPSERLDDTNLWIPLGEGHETWIKHLTSSILDSGGVKNEVLQLMKPLCEVS